MIRLCHVFQDDPEVGDAEGSTDDASRPGFRPDYISPLDDLAFDMYQDPEVAQIIRKLEKHKQEAVMREYFTSGHVGHPQRHLVVSCRNKKRDRKL